jgi:hypothetical protein
MLRRRWFRFRSEFRHVDLREQVAKILNVFGASQNDAGTVDLFAYDYPGHRRDK